MRTELSESLVGILFCGYSLLDVEEIGIPRVVRKHGQFLVRFCFFLLAGFRKEAHSYFSLSEA